MLGRGKPSFVEVMMTDRPGLRKRWQAAWQVFRHGYPRPPAQQRKQSFVSPLVTAGVEPQWHVTDFSAWAEDGFARNSIIYSAIMYKVRSKMSAPLRAYSGDPRAPEQLPPEHPLSQLVARPNPHQSGIEYQALAETYFNLGNYYGLLVRPLRGGLPERMYCLRPDRVYIVPEGNPERPWERSIKGYLYVPPGSSVYDGVPILPEDMMHVKLPNPADPLEGLGEGRPPVCIGQSADVDNEVTRFLKLFFEGGAMIQGVVKFDVPLDDESVDTVKERWREMYGGVDNWTEVGVLDQGGTYQRIGSTFDEMGFEAIDERNESRILGPFGVPPILIGTRTGLMRSTYSNYAEARRAYWEDTAIPEQDLFQVEYQYYLQSDDGGFVMFDRSGVPALQQDVPTLTEAAYQMWQMGVPAQQAFSTVGLQVGDVPGGNVSWLSASVVPAGSLPVEEEQTTEGAVEAEEDTRKAGGNGNLKLELMQSHRPQQVEMACPFCDEVGLDCYEDHGGLCVCRACGMTHDPEIVTA